MTSVPMRRPRALLRLAAATICGDTRAVCHSALRGICARSRAGTRAAVHDCARAMRGVVLADGLAKLRGFLLSIDLYCHAIF